MAKIKYNGFYLLCALALTVGLFLIGGRPGAGAVFKGHMHWIAHFLTYAVIAVSYAKGLPRVAVIWIACLVAGIGGLHELYEISSHSHGFEFNDFLVNSLGAFAGALASRFVSVFAPRPSDG